MNDNAEVKNGQITIQLNKQSGLCGELSETLDNLEHRLVDVSRIPGLEPDPVSETANKDKPCLVPIANQLKDCNVRLTLIIHRFKSLTDKIEI